jgi:hypothetical protein
MKTNKIILIISVILIAATFVYIGIQHRKIERLADQNQLQSVQIAVLNDSVQVYKDKNGELNYRLSVVEVSHNNLKESLEIAGWNLKQLKAKDIEWRNITNALKLRLETVGSGQAAIHDTILIAGRDSIISNYFDWSNNYLTLNGTVDIDQVSFEYYYRTSIDIIQHQKRNGTMVTVSLSDPNAAITSGNNIFLKQGKRWWEKPWLWGLAGLTTGILISK